MRVLVACEQSGVVRQAFAARGHEAWSCDLLPAADGSLNHYQQDVRQVIWFGPRWDLLIAHPPCDFLTNSAEWAYGDAPYHQRVKPHTLVGQARREAREKAAEFFLALWNANVCQKLCVENPIGCMNTRLAPVKPQIIQPHQFGEDASKATCLWLRGLPPLVGTRNFPPRIVEWPRGSGNMVKRWGNQTDSGQNKLPPSADRAAKRAVTYEGVAAAMAEQWSPVMMSQGYGSSTHGAWVK